MNSLYASCMSKTVLRAVESDAPASSNERTLERLGGSGAVESAKREDGTFRVRIITEGKGSSGIYSRELVQSPASAAVMDGLKSFFDHPDYSFAPEERSVLKLAGRFVPGTIEHADTEDGLAAAYGSFKPRKEYLEFFEEFADTLGVSVYLAATFSELPDGTRKVESFVPDPYNSIDIVVAAGRGGRFEQARESLRTIESSLGAPEGHKPGAEASAQEKEGNMLTKEEVQAIIAEALAPVASAVAELKTAVTEKATAEAEAEATAAAVKEALEGYDEKVQAITAEKDLLDSQRTALMESARAGEDIAPALESAKAIAAEAKAAFGAKGSEIEEDGFVFESGTSTTDDDSAFLAEAAGYKEA